MDKLQKGDYNFIVSSATQDIADIIFNDNLTDDQFDQYEEISELVERSLTENVPMKEWFALGIDDIQAAAIVDRIGQAKSEYDREELKQIRSQYMKEQNMNKNELFNRIYEDYNASYSGAENGPWSELEAEIGDKKRGKEMPPAIKGTPNFKRDDGGYGPIPRTGIGKRDYEAKYSKSGTILEESYEPDYPADPDDVCEICEAPGYMILGMGPESNMTLCKSCYEEESEEDRKARIDDLMRCGTEGYNPLEELEENKLPTHTKSGKLIERRVPPKGVVSPALRESIKAYEIRQYLKENKLVDEKDQHLLESEDDEDFGVMPSDAACSVCDTTLKFNELGDPYCPQCEPDGRMGDEDDDYFNVEAAELKAGWPGGGVDHWSEDEDEEYGGMPDDAACSICDTILEFNELGDPYCPQCEPDGRMGEEGECEKCGTFGHLNADNDKAMYLCDECYGEDDGEECPECGRTDDLDPEYGLCYFCAKEKFGDEEVE